MKTRNVETNPKTPDVKFAFYIIPNVNRNVQMVPIYFCIQSKKSIILPKYNSFQTCFTVLSVNFEKNIAKFPRHFAVGFHQIV